MAKTFEEWSQSGAEISLHSAFHAHDAEIAALKTEIAALREPMACGHEKRFWNDFGPGISSTGVTLAAIEKCALCQIDYMHKTACEHERLAVAAALREAAYLEWPHEYVKDEHGKPVTDRLCEDHRKHILALIPPADRSALDAHDAEVRDRALEEAAVRLDTSPVSAAASETVRALKSAGSK